MIINVKVFAALKDYFEPEFSLDVSEGLKISDIIDIIMVKSPFSSPVLFKSRVAVCENFVSPDYTLKENETIFIIPPSSGG